jgi:hypothetical protein
MTVNNKKINCIMITLIKIHIQMINQIATMYGYIMFALSGFHNVILNKKMDQLISKESKIYKREDLSINVQFAKK